MNGFRSSPRNDWCWQCAQAGCDWKSGGSGWKPLKRWRWVLAMLRPGQTGKRWKRADNITVAAGEGCNEKQPSLLQEIRRLNNA